jgi:hypothetical protein
MEPIKVFYSGYCITHNYDFPQCHDEYENDEFKNKKPIIQKSTYWLQPPDIYELFNTDLATIRHFDFLVKENVFPPKMIEKTSEVDGKKFLTIDFRKQIITPTDKDGNPDAFVLIKGQDIYKHENGNTLKVFWNDNAPQDTEKTMSERERRTALNIIYGLLDIIKKDTTMSQAEIISKLEKYGYHGLSKSTLEKYFSDANNIYKREHN